MQGSDNPTMPSWVRYSVAVYLGLLMAGTLVAPPQSARSAPVRGRAWSVPPPPPPPAVDADGDAPDAWDAPAPSTRTRIPARVDSAWDLTPDTSRARR